MIRMSTDAKDLARRLHKATIELNGAIIKSVNGATFAGQRFARRIAPRATGALYGGIQRQPARKVGKVIVGAIVSKVNKPFPYQFWVNEDIKTVALPIAKYGGHWPSGKYRNKLTTREWRYRDTKHTGIPGYFDLTYELLKKRLPVEMQIELRKTLKMGGK